MESNKRMIMLKFFRKFLYFLCFCCTLAIVIFIIAAFSMPFDSDIAKEYCTVPVSISMDPSNGDINIGAEEYFGGALNSEGKMNVRDGPLYLSYMNLSMYILAICLILYIFREFIKIIRSIENRKVFTIENAHRLRRIAISYTIYIVFLQILNIILAYFVEVSFDTRYTTQTLLSKGTFTLVFDFEEILFVVIVFIAAEIFRIGVKMKEEQDLTI